MVSLSFPSYPLDSPLALTVIKWTLKGKDGESSVLETKYMKMSSNVGVIPVMLEKTGLWNITTILAYAKNITKHQEAMRNSDDNSVVSIIIVCIGLILMMITWACTKDGLQVKCRSCRQQHGNLDVSQSSTSVESLSRISGVAAVWTRLQRKDTPPPPYEEPPSYDIALEIENEIQKSNQNYTS